MKPTQVNLVPMQAVQQGWLPFRASLTLIVTKTLRKKPHLWSRRRLVTKATGSRHDRPDRGRSGRAQPPTTRQKRTLVGLWCFSVFGGQVTVTAL